MTVPSWLNHPLPHHLPAPQASAPGADPPFDEAANRAQNCAWYAAKRAREEQRRAIHNAICDIQGMTADQQRQWLADGHEENLPLELFRRLHPEVRLEYIQRAKEAERAPMAARKAKRRFRRGDVEAFLRQAIPQGQDRPAAPVIQEALAAGICKRTLYRAKARLRIRSARHGFGAGGTFVWRWPSEGA